MKKMILVLLLCFIVYPVKAKDLYEYRINYYYDDILEESVIKRAEAADVINSFELKGKNDYILESSTIDKEGLIISTEEDKNIIDVYYSSENVKPVIDIIEESNNKNIFNNFIKNISKIIEYLINLLK